MKPTNGHVWNIGHWRAPAPVEAARHLPAWSCGELGSQANIELITLGNLGMTRKTIAQFTGLTLGQVSYRLRHFGVSTTTFRHGQGPIAQLVFQRLASRVTQKSIQLVREHELQTKP